MGVNGKRQKFGSKYRFYRISAWNVLILFWFSTEVWSKKQLWRKNVGVHRIGFEIIPLFVLKIVLADTGYIEVQYTKIKSAQVNR